MRLLDLVCRGGEAVVVRGTGEKARSEVSKRGSRP